MNNTNAQADEISLVPFKKELFSYSWESFRFDLLAGFNVALLTIPQAVGYALLAGLPLFCGLFAAIYSSIMAALFGSSRHLIVGPSNAMAVMLQAGVAEILFTYYRDVTGPEREFIALQLVMQIALLVGFLQMLMVALKLGRLMQFVSHSVVIGYMAGAAIALTINQLFPFLGIQLMPGVNSFYARGEFLVTHLSSLYWPTALVGLCSLLLIILLRRFDKRLPAGLITFVIAGLAVHFLGWDYSPLDSLENSSHVLLIRDVASTFDVIPHFNLAFIDLGILNASLPVAFALAMVSIMESTSVAKSIAAASGQRLSVNQEIFGISLGNLLSSFIQGMTIAGNSSRSSLNFNCGGQTRFAAIFSALTVALFLYGFGNLVSHIPLAALAALLLYTAVNIVNPKHFFLCVKATGSDAFVLCLTTLSCIFLSLDVAFYIGIAMSVTLYLKKAAVPHLREYEVDEFGELKHLDLSDSQEEHKQIRVIKVEGELFFGAADLFQTTLKTIAEDDTSTRVIILQLKNARDIDATACLALSQLHDYLIGSGRHLIACGLMWQIWEVLSDSGIIEIIGKENLFVFDERRPHEYMQRALARAKELTQPMHPSQPLIEEPVKTEEELLPQPELPPAVEGSGERDVIQAQI